MPQTFPPGNKHLSYLAIQYLNLPPLLLLALPSSFWENSQLTMILKSLPVIFRRKSFQFAHSHCSLPLHKMRVVYSSSICSWHSFLNSVHHSFLGCWFNSWGQINHHAGTGKRSDCFCGMTLAAVLPAYPSEDPYFLSILLVQSPRVPFIMSLPNIFTINSHLLRWSGLFLCA